MILFEWIEHYINTPEWQRTLADEILFLTAISVILIVGFTVIGFIAFVSKRIYDCINEIKDNVIALKQIDAECRFDTGRKVK